VTDGDAIEGSLIDGARFALVFDRHFRAIHRFLQARVGSQLADDLASETFVIAFRRRASFDRARDDARPWLHGIAVNLLREHRRSEDRRLRAFTRLAHEGPGAVPDLEPCLDPTVAAALLELSLAERNLLLLYAWAELSYEELAEALALPIGTIRSRLNRVRSKLDRRLTGLNEALVPRGDAS
jgi:RNA polymerase sigma factor (sigma-70 family)